MAVVRSKNCLWLYPVQYEPLGNAVVNKSILTLNEAVGFALFVERTDQSQLEHHVKFHVDTEEACSHIGCAFAGLQTINLKASSDLFTCLHEMMHCLGFEHEQFHKEYPWDPDDKPRKNPFYTVSDEVSVAQAASIRMNVDTTNWNPEKKTANWGEGSAKARSFADVEKPAQSSKPKKLELPFIFKSGSSNQHIYEFLASKQNPTYAQSYWEQVAKKRAESIESLTALCDYDSIMMYKEFKDAAGDLAKNRRQINTVGSGKLSDNCLSNSDVQAVRELYGSFK